MIALSTNTLLGTLPLGNARPDELLGALYNKQINTRGLGFSKDGSMLAAVDVTTNGVSIIETRTNRVMGTVYLRRAPHEGFFTPDCRELWVAVRGEDFVSVIDVNKMQEVDRIQTSDGAAMVIFQSRRQIRSAKRRHSATHRNDSNGRRPARNLGESRQPARLYLSGKRRAVQVIDTTSNTVISTMKI